MKNLVSPEIWFLTGSQYLYGQEALRQVAEHSQKIVAELNGNQKLPLNLVFKPVLTRPEEIRTVCIQANSTANCGGRLLWVHTFSPSKMWLSGVFLFSKPLLPFVTPLTHPLPPSPLHTTLI